ncbi:hypothetical protein DCO48_19855 [Pseudomonas sp. SDI]|uniref:hypothetical protein n=1 Tax=Pseudomonas sp. SDI TaxID=2170734 RepID=UPI000DE79DA3|nr:hypothetical protein [Pseudomonas sp. SDI]PWB30596.1 hypothetical protein DCO48_19855 [Pseudomonas sp. SDI]
MQDPSIQGASAAVVAGSLSAFMPSVSQEDRDDILLANLYAQRVTRAAHAEGLVGDWLSYYRNVLKYLGWDATPAPDTRLPGKSRESVVDEALAQIAQLGAGELSLANGWALNALKRDGPALALFERSARAKRAVNFQLMPCVHRQGPYIDMLLHHQQLEVSESTTAFLFARHSSAVKLLTSSTELVRFNVQLFRRDKRQQVQAKVSAEDRRLLLSLKL